MFRFRSSLLGSADGSLQAHRTYREGEKSPQQGRGGGKSEHSTTCLTTLHAKASLQRRCRARKSPGWGHRAASSASSPAEPVEPLSKCLSIKHRKKLCAIVSAFSPGRFTGGFIAQCPLEPGTGVMVLKHWLLC